MKIRIVKKDGSNYVIEAEAGTVYMEENKLRYQVLGYYVWKDVGLEDVKAVAMWNE